MRSRPSRPASGSKAAAAWCRAAMPRPRRGAAGVGVSGGGPPRGVRPAPADAAWLVERIAIVDPNEGRSRLGMLAFAQRVFTGADAEADPADLLVALRGLGRYRALALALERMGVRDPSLYAAATRSAEQIEAAGHGERGRATLAEFHGTLVLVERAVAAG